MVRRSGSGNPRRPSRSGSPPRLGPGRTAQKAQRSRPEGFRPARPGSERTRSERTRSERTRSERPRPERPRSQRPQQAPSRPPRPQPVSGSRAQQRAPIEQVLAAQDWDSLIPHLLRAGTSDPEGAIEVLRRYARLLLEWNRSVSNLISGNDESRILDRHIREALEPGYWLREAGGSRWLDFGAGAGLPGIPLAVAGIGEHWTLVESRRPKVLFMRKAIEDLGLRGIDVYHGRLETLVEEAEGQRTMDGFVSRATMHLAPTLEIAKDIVVKGGNTFLWKGSRRDEESASDAAWARHWELTGILGVGDGHTAVMRFSRTE